MSSTNISKTTAHGATSGPMKALVFEKSLPRFAAARVASMWQPGAGGRVGPLRLRSVAPPSLPSNDWVRLTTRLSGICGSDLSTIDAHATRYHEPIVSFPFVPGHEVVANTVDGDRVVIEPVLGCVARGISPVCNSCAKGRLGNCENVAFGHLKPGLQTGYCCDTGGGWGQELVAHTSQLHSVPNEFSDEDAVMVEPIACAVHAALSGQVESGDTVAVIGAGTLGLGVIAALREFGATPSHLIVAAKYAHQHKFATEFGATDVCKPAELRRTVRSLTRSLAIGPVGNERLTGGANVVFDCVGSSDSIADGIAIAGPRGRIVLVGMPGNTTLDLTGLWQRELTLAGAYAYGTEDLINTGAPRRTFDLAFELVAKQQLGRLVSARYPIEHASHALDHAANAGRRGAIKVVFDHRRTSRKGTQ